jgi:hypothetical protein
MIAFKPYDIDVLISHVIGEFNIKFQIDPRQDLVEDVVMFLRHLGLKAKIGTI